jgi:hypothetical protein
MIIVALRLWLAAGALFISVHAPDDQQIFINVTEISSIRQPRDTENQHFQKDVNCVIVMNNGKFIGTIESCLDIIRLIAEISKDEK